MIHSPEPLVHENDFSTHGYALRVCRRCGSHLATPASCPECGITRASISLTVFGILAAVSLLAVCYFAWLDTWADISIYGSLFCLLISLVLVREFRSKLRRKKAEVADLIQEYEARQTPHFRSSYPREIHCTRCDSWLDEYKWCRPCAVKGYKRMSWGFLGFGILFGVLFFFLPELLDLYPYRVAIYCIGGYLSYQCFRTAFNFRKLALNPEINENSDSISGALLNWKKRQLVGRDGRIESHGK